MQRLDEHDRLRRRYLEPLAAPHIFAGKLVIDPHHIIARFFESRPVLLRHPRRLLLLFGSLHPSDVVVVPFAAERAGIVRLFYFLSFIENIALVHHKDIVTFFAGKSRAWSTSGELPQVGKTEYPRVVSVGEMKIEGIASDDRDVAE